jgi:hypothetical protein
MPKLCFVVVVGDGKFVPASGGSWKPSSVWRVCNSRRILELCGCFYYEQDNAYLVSPSPTSHKVSSSASHKIPSSPASHKIPPSPASHKVSSSPASHKVTALFTPYEDLYGPYATIWRRSVTVLFRV